MTDRTSYIRPIYKFFYDILHTSVISDDDDGKCQRI